MRFAKDVRTGAGALLNVPLGFSVQPSLLYHQKEAMLTDHIGQIMGYLELPVSVQWGPDLLLFRPFLDVTPFVGYGLNNSISGFSQALQAFKTSNNQWEGMNRVEYGLGLGVGIDVWKLQVIGRYNWNFGKLYEVDGWNDIKEHFGALNHLYRYVLAGKFSGIQFRLPFFAQKNQRTLPRIETLILKGALQESAFDAYAIVPKP